MSGEGQSYLLPISGLDQIVNIDKWSNTDVPGLWIYRSLGVQHLYFQTHMNLLRAVLLLL